MKCTKYIQPNYWIRQPILCFAVLLVLLTFIGIRLPECRKDKVSPVNRSSRLDKTQIKKNEGHADDTNEALFGAKTNTLLNNKWRTHDNKLTIGGYKDIDCLINDDYTVIGRRQGNETFIPFSFLAKHFEINGKLDKRRQRFEWHHSTARVYEQMPYKPDGVFMTFNHYHVDERVMVKYISGVHGVPKTVQWDPDGYFYATQIAQFGLSHYSKNLTDAKPVVIVYEDAEDDDSLRKWQRTSSSDVSIQTVYDDERASNVVEFHMSQVSSSSKGFVLTLNSEHEFVLSFDAMFLDTFAICVTVEPDDGRKTIKIIYTNDEDTVTYKNSNIIYGLGQLQKWRKITRNLVTDYRKGITQTNKTSLKKSQATLRKVKSISVLGSGRIDNITLQTHDHMAHFINAAYWLLRNQDLKGGWPVLAKRKLDAKFATLAPGWYSAMAQGQAISTLVRAYKLTNDYSFLAAALHATKLYKIPSSEGGVLAIFLDTFPWYEEYPTTPGSFVLNGFIFSLIGLYDLKSIANAEEGREAARFFEDGMNSLKHMLHMYDTGSGSSYDLGHVTIQSPPNLARWGYHATHIAQLQLLASIDSDPIFQTTLKRWIGYTKGMKGKRQRNKRQTQNEAV